jgi:hypothetical protein
MCVGRKQCRDAYLWGLTFVTHTREVLHSWRIRVKSYIRDAYAWSLTFVKHTCEVLHSWRIRVRSYIREAYTRSHIHCVYMNLKSPDKCKHHLRSDFVSCLKYFCNVRCKRLWGWYISSEIWTSSIYWALLRIFHLKMETESSLRNVVLLSKKNRMDSVQEHNNCNFVIC